MSVLRIAMWSGPRNISTAMMRAFENRPDCCVSDEPLYAHYLAHSGIDHPGAAEVIASGDSDWRRVTEALLGAPADDKSIWYQKHMSQHMLAHIERDFIHSLLNVFLIRDPVEVVASYLNTRSQVCADDIGSAAQAQLFDEVAERQGYAPMVIAAATFLRAPEAHLRALCAGLEIDFSPRMLSWPLGPRASDGVWAKHWYQRVWESTGFEPAPPRIYRLDQAAQRVAEQARPHYERLLQHALLA